MMKYFLFFILLFSFYAFAGEQKLKIELMNKDNNIRLFLINYGNDVLVNARFSMKHYPKFPPEVQFEIINKEGKKYPFSHVHINEASVSEKDIVLLGTGNIVGIEYHITELIVNYHLEPGIYKTRVTYENVDDEFKGVYIGQLTSNWVTFEVPKNKEDIVWPDKE